MFSGLKTAKISSFEVKKWCRNFCKGQKFFFSGNAQEVSFSILNVFWMLNLDNGAQFTIIYRSHS